MENQTHSTHSIPNTFNWKWIPAHWALDMPEITPELPIDLTQDIKLLAVDTKLKTSTKANDYVEFQEKVEEIMYQKKQTPYWFVTINPKPEVDFNTLHELCSEIFNSPKILEAVWTYELRGKNSGLHCHAIFHLEKIDKNFASRNLRKKLVPNICGTTKHVHIKWITKNDIEKTLGYINKSLNKNNKKKCSISKMSSATATAEWRREKKIKPYYRAGEEHLLVCSDPGGDGPEPVFCWSRDGLESSVKEL